MRRTPALFIVLLVVVGTVGAATPAVPSASAAPVPSITSINGTTNQLSIPDEDVRTSEFASSDLDVGTAVSIGSQKLRHEHETESFERAFRRAESDFERTQLLRAELETINDRGATLTTRQDRAIDQYGSGSSTVTAFVQTRALVDAEARQLLTRIERIERLNRNVPGYSMSSGMATRLENIKANVRMLRGPVGQHFSAALTGETTGTAIYVETGSEGYMLGMIRDGEYVSETHLGSQRAPNAPDQFDQSGEDLLRTAADRAETLYPWLYDRQLPSVQTYGTSQIYQIRGDHSQGRLTAYIDGGTTDVFREIQHRQLSTVTVTDTRSTVNGSVRVDVNRVFRTGPLLVTVTENSTGAPVAGSVSIDGQPVGRTGPDGALWTVEPRDSYTVAVNTTDGERVVVMVPGRSPFVTPEPSQQS